MADKRRTDVGFKGGGPALSVRIAADAYDKLVQALEDDKSGRWHNLDTDDSSLLIDLSQVVYIQRESENAKVGF